MAEGFKSRMEFEAHIYLLERLNEEHKKALKIALDGFRLVIASENNEGYQMRSVARKVMDEINKLMNKEDLVSENKRLKAENQKLKCAESDRMMNELFAKTIENLKAIKDGLESLRRY